MKKVSTIGLDLAKNVFQAHGADASGAVIFRKKLRRAQVLEFFATQPACTVAMEACGGSHFWGREIGNAESSSCARTKSDRDAIGNHRMSQSSEDVVLVDQTECRKSSTVRRTSRVGPHCA